MIEQQRVQISDLKEQINSLTASPDGDSSPVALQRQIQKLNKSIKMKDEFCSILSLELKKVQDELRVTKEKSMKSSKDVQDGQSKDSGISSEGNAEQEVCTMTCGDVLNCCYCGFQGNVFSIDIMI